MPEDEDPPSAAAPARPFPRRAVRFLLYVGPAAAWMALLYALSTDLGSFEASLRLLIAALDYGIPPAARYAPLDQRFLLQVNVVLRDVANVLAYGVLVVLIVRAFQYGQARLKVVSAAAAFLVSLGYALFEMLHRRGEPSRHGTLGDVRLNLIGIALFLVGTLLYFALKHAERRLGGGDSPVV